MRPRHRRHSHSAIRELRELIQRMSGESPLWRAPRIHGELLKLGFEIAESTVSKYMIRRRGPPSQTWRAFLCNHAHAIAAIDFCVVPTLTFECLFAFLVLGHGRRSLNKDTPIRRAIQHVAIVRGTTFSLSPNRRLSCWNLMLVKKRQKPSALPSESATP
jgi:hypothetical protein